jgi:hypothetical protein
MVSKRRYEILLPAKFNDGRSIMVECMECFPETLARVLDQFGALSYNPHSIMGVWTHGGKRYEDELFKLTVDVDDTAEARDFIAHLKAEMLQKFEQLEIYVVSYAIEVI